MYVLKRIFSSFDTHTHIMHSYAKLVFQCYSFITNDPLTFFLIEEKENFLAKNTYGKLENGE